MQENKTKWHKKETKQETKTLPWAQKSALMRETWVQSQGWEDPLEKEMAIHSVFWPGEFHGQRNLAGYSPWGCKELDWVTFIFTVIQVFIQQKWFRIQTWWFVIHYYFYHCIALHTSCPVQLVLTIITTIKTNIYQALIIFQAICYIICTYFLI